jgi:hypothetical protein
MGVVTTVTFIFNASGGTATFINRETGMSWSLDSSIGQHTSWAVPWCCQPGEFGLHHLEVSTGPALTYFIWQCTEGDGAYVRQSTDGFHFAGEHMFPSGAAGGDRALVLRSDLSLYLGYAG